MSKHKIVLTGASGYVGARIYKDLKDNGFEVVGLYNKNKLFEDLVQVDITNETKLVEILEETNPEIIIYAAADGHIGTCENDPENAQRLNVDATSYIADYAKKNDVRVIYISTFACYSPLHILGKTKTEAERIIKGLENYVILRFPLCVGKSPNTKGYSFYNNLIGDYEAGKPIETYADWEYEITYLGDISSMIKTLINKPEVNKVLIPIAAKGITTSCQLARDLFEVEVAEIHDGFNVPIPDFDNDIYEKFDLKRSTYEEDLEQMKKELEGI